jgi:hypothetical protein
MSLHKPHRRFSSGIQEPWFGVVWIFFLSIWFAYSGINAKVRGFIGATTFTLIEYTFYTLTYELPDGTVVFSPGDPRCRKGHTTPHQWFVNVLCLPFFLDEYFRLMPQTIVRALCWPLNIWSLEIVEGLLLILTYGYNPAWEYYGPGAYVFGTIQLNYWKFWLPMGFAIHFIGWDALVFVSDSLVDAYWKYR